MCRFFRKTVTIVFVTLFLVYIMVQIEHQFSFSKVKENFDAIFTALEKWDTVFLVWLWEGSEEEPAGLCILTKNPFQNCIPKHKYLQNTYKYQAVVNLCLPSMSADERNVTTLGIKVIHSGVLYAMKAVNLTSHVWKEVL